MSRLLGIDPGPDESAFVLIDREDRRPLEVGLIPNEQFLEWLGTLCLDPDRYANHVEIEMVESYGMPVGKPVFETCVTIGRVIQQVALYTDGAVEVRRISRSQVRQGLCHSNKATDANVSAALVERFAPDARNKGKGTKAEPGWFYGFKDDIWSAYAIAVCAADRGEGFRP